jgi:hypothetical protein
MNSAEIRSSLGTILWMLRWTNETVWLTISLKILLTLEQQKESSLPNNDARVDIKRHMIVLTGTRCTYFELKTTHKTFCMVIYAAIHCYISYKLALKLLLTLEQQKESSVPGPGLDSMPVISNNVHSTHNYWVSLTSEIVLASMILWAIQFHLFILTFRVLFLNLILFQPISYAMIFFPLQKVG